ncbi:MAG: hypothetical protein HOO99_04080 [Hyphomicrobiaceae bacterium]|nr:hypothetical protein [Hyphomicrobiaceae bacterium]
MNQPMQHNDDLPEFKEQLAGLIGLAQSYAEQTADHLEKQMRLTMAIGSCVDVISAANQRAATILLDALEKADSPHEPVPLTRAERIASCIMGDLRK